ncbi:MAG: 3-oxoacyl-ACP synthase III [Planctomycetota bacterium]|nr:MAG: 3-oxoacyl-ACP synthase III [Planctomycetota bacterium]REJ98557.1 MAG: 3-oxoacyl-ACP synthase III [Planctomycetota bacterium]REK29857.1 MAG: 3-oxoacyl-ACP synthase III [Planctomycetota bacterium]REK47972.1 MAG: 3-oxoacyl-ACP synthase III [Planctomycetota bacterium]
MRYQNVCLEGFGYQLPEQVVTSGELEQWLAPVYQRLRLPSGRLELMTGIRERRLWPPDTRGSAQSVLSAEQALETTGVPRAQIGALVHGSVCRDHLEPATACRVHHELRLPSDCQIFDVSNACLGLLNGLLLVANMIELGQIRAGLVVGTENCRPLVETTVRELNEDESLTRERIKLAVASLTIGSASCAFVLTDRELSRTDNRVLGGACRAETRFHGLCHSGADEAGAQMQPLMQTDSEQLMHEGIATGAATYAQFLAELGWQTADVAKVFTHQVGVAHRRAMLGALGIDEARDFSTVELLGNTGSVALPISMAIGIEQGHLTAGEQVALLGIGSGINSVMVAVDWQKSLCRASTETSGTSPQRVDGLVGS